VKAPVCRADARKAVRLARVGDLDRRRLPPARVQAGHLLARVVGVRPPKAASGKGVKPSTGNSPRRTKTDGAAPVRRQLGPDAVGRADGPRCIQK
jgi:hypothetical protein